MKVLGIILLGLGAGGTYLLCSRPKMFSGLDVIRPERKTTRARILMAAKRADPRRGLDRISELPDHGMTRATARAWNRAAFEHPSLRRVREDW